MSIAGSCHRCLQVASFKSSLRTDLVRVCASCWCDQSPPEWPNATLAHFALQPFQPVLRTVHAPSPLKSLLPS